MTQKDKDQEESLSLPMLFALNHIPTVGVVACVVAIESAEGHYVGAAFAALLPIVGAAVAKWSYKKIAARISRLAHHAQTLASDGIPEAFPPGPKDGLGKLEDLLGTLADHIEKRSEQLRAETRRQQVDAQIQRAVGMADSEADVVEVAGRALAMVIPNYPAEILLADSKQSALHLAAISATGESPGCPVETASGCAALRRSQTLRFAQSDALDACPRLRNRPEGKCSAVCVPLSVMGKAIGVLHATTPVDVTMNDNEAAGLESIASHVGARLGMLASLETFQAQALTDPLTGLLNRRSFEAAAANLLQQSAPFVVAIADLDHFKRLNDDAGHDAGDQALKLFAQTLKAGVRPYDVVGRLGGEEFAMLLPRCTQDGAVQLLDRLRDSLAAALKDTVLPRFTASFGVSTFPKHGTTLQTLLKAADEALYQSKRCGRDQVTCFGEAPFCVVPSIPVAVGAEGAGE